MPPKKPAKPPPKPNPATVDSFLAALDHPLKKEVLTLREIILAADPGITEEIKWNVPSFRTSEHFATLNLRVKAGIAVILHFGAKKNAISAAGVTIHDPASLLIWIAKDRAVVGFLDAQDLAAKRIAFTNLIREWIQHL